MSACSVTVSPPPRACARRVSAAARARGTARRLQAVEHVARDALDVRVARHEHRPVGRRALEDDAAARRREEPIVAAACGVERDQPRAELRDAEDEERRRRAVRARSRPRGRRRAWQLGAVALVAEQREVRVIAEDVAVLEPRALVDPVTGVLDRVADGVAPAVPPAAGVVDADARRAVLGVELPGLVALPRGLPICSAARPWRTPSPCRRRSGARGSHRCCR